MTLAGVASDRGLILDVFANNLRPLANTGVEGQTMKTLTWDRRELAAGMEVYEAISGRVRVILAARATGLPLREVMRLAEDAARELLGND